MSSTGPVDGPRLAPPPAANATEGKGGTGALARLATGDAIALGELSIVVGSGRSAPLSSKGLDALLPPGGLPGARGNGLHIAALKADTARERVAALDGAMPGGETARALGDHVAGLLEGRTASVAALADALQDGGPAFVHAALGELAAAVRGTGGDFETAARDALAATARSGPDGALVVAALGSLASTHALATPGSERAVLGTIARKVSAD